MTQNITKAIFFLTRKFIFVLYSIKRNQTQRIMEALPSNPFYPESYSEIKWAVRPCCDFLWIDAELMVPQLGLALQCHCCTDSEAMAVSVCLASLLSSSLPPSSSSLLVVLLSPYFCWQSSFRPSLVLTSSSQLSSSAFVVNAQPCSSGLCFYSQLCHKLLVWPGTSPAPSVPHSWSCSLSQRVQCPIVWALLEVTKNNIS